MVQARVLRRQAVKPEEVMNFSRQMSSFLRAGVPILDSLQRRGRGERVEEDAGSARRHAAPPARGFELRRRDRGAHRRSSPATTSPSSARPSSPANSTTRSTSSPAYLEREVAARREIKSSLTYPTIVFFLAIAAVIIMSVYVLPEVPVFYTSLSAKLPLPTRMLLGFTNFICHWWPVILGVIVALVVGRLLAARRKSRARRAATSCLLRPAGHRRRSCTSIAIERFCRVLGALVHTGVPLPDAVQVSADSTNNCVFQTKLAVGARGDDARRRSRPTDHGLGHVPARSTPDDPRGREHRLARRAASQRRGLLRSASCRSD